MLEKRPLFKWNNFLWSIYHVPRNWKACSVLTWYYCTFLNASPKHYLYHQLSPVTNAQKVAGKGNLFLHCIIKGKNVIFIFRFIAVPLEACVRRCQHHKHIWRHKHLGNVEAGYRHQIPPLLRVQVRQLCQSKGYNKFFLLLIKRLLLHLIFFCNFRQMTQSICWEVKQKAAYLEHV
jgi:hypothetical protein